MMDYDNLGHDHRFGAAYLSFRPDRNDDQSRI